jgi:hypothetical protein
MSEGNFTPDHQLCPDLPPFLIANCDNFGHVHPSRNMFLCGGWLWLDQLRYQRPPDETRHSAIPTCDRAFAIGRWAANRRRTRAAMRLLLGCCLLVIEWAYSHNYTLAAVSSSALIWLNWSASAIISIPIRGFSLNFLRPDFHNRR